ARLDRAAEIDDRVGIAKQFHASLARHADIFVASRIEERPPIAEAVAIEDAAEHLQISRSVAGIAVESRIVNVRLLLDIVNVEAELSKPDQVVKQLPDHPCERVSPRQMQYDDFALALALHLLRGDLSARLRSL